MNQLLFSYGTLQMEAVQMDTFGRRLNGSADCLRGYRLDTVEILDDDVVESSGLSLHPIARKSDDPRDIIEGTVFQLSEQEIRQADTYEAEPYQRVKVQLDSGRNAWIYTAR